MRTLNTTALFVALAAAGAAFAVPAAGPDIDLREATRIVEQAGYGPVRGAERDDGAWEVAASRADGRPLTVYVDARSGEILWPAQPGQRQLDAAEVMAKLAEAGYTDVRELERDDGFWKAEVRVAGGFERDLRIHPLSGEIQAERWDD